MTIRSEDSAWYNRLFERCKPGLSTNEWYQLGGEIHTLHGDYQWLHDFYAAKEDLDSLWLMWKNCEPKWSQSDDPEVCKNCGGRTVLDNDGSGIRRCERCNHLQ